MVRDALIREVCPTEEVCCLMAAFLQRLPLPRLVHFLDMILPQMVPVQSTVRTSRETPHTLGRPFRAVWSANLSLSRIRHTILTSIPPALGRPFRAV